MSFDDDDFDNVADSLINTSIGMDVADWVTGEDDPRASQRTKRNRRIARQFSLFIFTAGVACAAYACFHSDKKESAELKAARTEIRAPKL